MSRVIAFILCLLSCSGFAATNTAASTSHDDVQAAINLSADGDTVLIPPGTSAWSNYITNRLNFGLTLMGSGTNSTFILDNLAGNFSLISMFATNKLIRISSMTLGQGGSSYALINLGTITMSNLCRCDNLLLTNLQHRGIEYNGWTAGCIDHSVFASKGQATGIDIHGYGNLNISIYGGALNSNPSWDTIPFFLGNTNMVYIENCLFIWPLSGINANGAIDSYNGGRWCFRYNIITNINVGAHGTDSGGTLRSAHTFEVYGNKTYFTSTTTDFIPFSFRGGTGIFFSNEVWALNGKGVNGIRIDNYRSSGTNIFTIIAPTPCCGPYGPTTFTNVYGGRQTSSGWPSYDQIGFTSPTIYGPTNTVQVQQPLYEWSNTFNGALGLAFYNPTVFTNTGPYSYIPPSNLIIETNRDYFDGVPLPGYVPAVYPYPLVGPPTTVTSLARVTKLNVTTTHVGP